MGRKPEYELEPLRARPKLVEVMQMLLEERHARTSLDLATIAKVQQTVEAALPDTIEKAERAVPQLDNPVERLAYVGTQYAYRTTPEMIQSLRETGYDDTGILDLAIAVADANDWARAYRLYGLDPCLLYCEE